MPCPGGSGVQREGGQYMIRPHTRCCLQLEHVHYPATSMHGVLAFMQPCRLIKPCTTGIMLAPAGATPYLSFVQQTNVHDARFDYLSTFSTGTNANCHEPAAHLPAHLVAPRRSTSSQSCSLAVSCWTQWCRTAATASPRHASASSSC